MISTHPTRHDQCSLRRHVRTLERQQAERIVAVEACKAEMDAVVERAQRELDNYRNQLTVKGVS